VIACLWQWQQVVHVARARPAQSGPAWTVTNIDTSWALLRVLIDQHDATTLEITQLEVLKGSVA
jgi:hypothetical protein